MLRKSCPFWVAVLTLMTGCDFFSSREILPKPSDIHSFQGLFIPGDSLVFRVTESVRETGSKTDKQLLSKRRLVFTFLGDSLVKGIAFKLVAMKIQEDPSGYLVEEARRLLDISGSGLTLVGPVEGGGARFYPFKAAASADTSSYLALPMVFAEGWSMRQALGMLVVNRELSPTTDTVPYLAHSEATWKIIESVSDRGINLVQGQYWYGASGLLKAEQVWLDFEWREANASKPGTVDLHRRLERL